ncbi:MAG: hypothetical protein AB4080_14195 [Trichodesmium sp.]
MKIFGCGFGWRSLLKIETRLELIRIESQRLIFFRKLHRMIGGNLGLGGDRSDCD